MNENGFYRKYVRGIAETFPPAQRTTPKPARSIRDNTRLLTNVYSPH